MSRKKVAILLCGQPRFLRNPKPIESYIRYVQSLHDCDVFAFVWFSPCETSYKTSTWSRISDVSVHPDTLSLIHQMYHPIILQDCPSMTFWPQNENTPPLSAANVEKLKTFNPSNINNVFSQMYALKRSADLLEDHIAKTGTAYDFVVKLRTDLYFDSFPNFNELSPVHFSLSSHHDQFPDLCFIFPPQFIRAMKPFDMADRLIERALCINTSILSMEAMLQTNFQDLFAKDRLMPLKSLEYCFLVRDEPTNQVNAVVICGLYRSLDTTLDNILRNFVEPNNADVFLVLSNEPPLNATAITRLGARLKSHHVLSSTELAVPLQHIGLRTEKMQTLLDQDELLLKSEKVDIVKYYQNNAIQFIALSKAYDLVTEYEHKMSISYDHIIKVRTDMVYDTKLRIQTPSSDIDAFRNLLLRHQIVSNHDFYGLVFNHNSELFERYIKLHSLEDGQAFKEERKDQRGRLMSFLNGHVSSRLIGGAYYENTKITKMNKNQIQKENFFYLINDHVLAFDHRQFEYVKDFHKNGLGIITDWQKTCFFWTPEYQLAAYIDAKEENVMVMHIYGDKA